MSIRHLAPDPTHVRMGNVSGMLTYALIALGGALGSVLRAAMGVAIATLTGPAFPWGTILINVLGSFVIGLFATLTATDGRFVVPPDLRAFVMVGVCGGFTTFSSFSLQTLDLLRDDRPGQALANIVLSILLCLAGVAVGHAGAAWLRTFGPTGLAAAVPDDGARRSLVALHRPEMAAPMLAMAAGLMDRGADRTTVLAIDGPALADLQPTEELLTRERRDGMAARQRWIEAMRPELDRWMVAERKAGYRARWVEVRGDGIRAIVEHGRGAHLLLLEHRPDDAAGLRRIHAVLVRTHRPVLLVPPDAPDLVDGCVAVAWRENPQARAAVRATMPILFGAGRIVLLEIGGDPRAALPNGLFGGRPVERRIVPDDGDVGARLLTLAREEGADLLVMGSHGCGPVREALFDGVTERVLRQAHLPVLLHPG